MSRAKDAPIIRDWSGAMGYAMLLLDQVDPRHRLVDVSMGTYSERVDHVGGTHYVDFRISYSMGSAANGAPQTREQRIHMITKAWVEAQQRLAEKQAAEREDAERQAQIP